jgi:hypothetical protein
MILLKRVALAAAMSCLSETAIAQQAPPQTPAAASLTPTLSHKWAREQSQTHRTRSRVRPRLARTRATGAAGGYR